MSIDTTVKLKANTLRLKWLKRDWRSSNTNTTSKSCKNSFSTRPSKKRSANKLTSNSTSNLTSNGTKIFFKHSKKTHKPLVPWKIDTPKRSSRTDKFWRKSCHFNSNTAASSQISKRCNLTWRSKRSKFYLNLTQSFNVYSYQEAHKMQQQCQELEKEESEKYMGERQKKIIAAEAKLISKQ